MLTNDSNDDVDERIRSKYVHICEQLDIDETKMNSTWDTYRSIRNDHTLEGGQIQWLCCALYVSLTDKSDELSEISLTKLLRLCNIKIYEFLKRTEQWFNMLNTTSRECRERFKRLRTGLSVSILAYEKYSSLFREYFVAPNYSEEAALAAATISTPQKGKKSKQNNKCTPNNVYEFCWYLFILAKGENPEYTMDLVTSFHVLLCCIDLIFANVCADKRDDLLNMNFGPAATVLNGKDTKPTKQTTSSSSSSSTTNGDNNEPISIIKELCEQQQASEVDALEIKSYNWKDLMRKFFRDNILKGNANTFLGILSAQNYDFNIKSLKGQYDAYIRRVDKIDEGIFLLQAPSDNLSDPKTHSQIIKTLAPETPLTCRNRLPGRDSILASPVTNATQNVNRLHHHLDNCLAEPSKNLKDLIKLCGVNPFPEVEALLKKMRDKFMKDVRMNSSSDRFELAVKLYYNLFEKIIRKERSQKQNFEPKILRNTKFHMILMATSVEIVIYAYGASQKFPWVLNCFDLNAFEFYKLIEIIVLNEEGILNRDLIKHLNAIEEQCLESLAWKNNSPLWTEIADWLSRHHSLPKQEDTISSSIGLFFRKFYKLAFVRIDRLATDLDLKSNQNLQKIWTTFEYSILHRVDLMKDRHLDQLIMCSIYIFARARNLPTKFKDIMTHYRTQPQAESHIYREVLGTDNNRCDIIDFYNRIYVRDMQEFVLRLRGSDDVTLSPLPINIRAQSFPRKISQNHCIYVQELQSNEILQSPEAITYTFISSPIQNFRKIDSLTGDEHNSNGKRTLPFTGVSEVAEKDAKDAKDAQKIIPYTNKKLRSLITDRQEKNDK